MKFANITVVYNRLAYKSKTGRYPVHFRIHYCGYTDYVKIKEIPNIHRDDWMGDERHGRWTRHSLLINEKITEALSAIRKFADEAVMKGSPVTIQSIKDFYAAPEKLESFNNFVEDFIRNINKKKQDKEKLAYRTILAYQSFLVKLNKYNSNIQFHQINPQLLEDFNDFLAGECQLVKTTRAKHFDKLRVTYNAAVSQKLADYIPGMFKGYLARSEPQRVVLSVKEIIRIESTSLSNPNLDFYRRIFLLQLLTGIYYNDLKVVKVNQVLSTNIQENGAIKEVHYLKGNRIKNDQQYVIRLFPKTLILLEADSNLNSGKPNELLYPDLISEGKYNSKLKIIAKELGIDKNLTNKVARHSFGSWMISIGNTREKLGAYMGHTDQKTTKIYSELSTEETIRNWIEPDI